MDFSQRCLLPERMDDPNLDPVLHAEALQGLRRINLWSRTSRVVGRAISRIASERGWGNLRILDVACGGGDLVGQLSRQSLLDRPGIRIDGCDISHTAVDLARTSARHQGLNRCHFFVHDALRDPLPNGYDVIVSTLFLHHLNNDQTEALIRNMAGATRYALLIDDLRRSRVGYWLAQVGCRLLSRSPIVHYDGPVSVRAAYTVSEVATLTAKAGLQNVRIETHWPQRYLVSWNKSA